MIFSNANPLKNQVNGCVMEIRAGTGGDEAGLFCSNLYRAYTRFCQKMNWKINEISRSEGGVGNIKEVVFAITNPDQRNLYDLFKSESGVHRVQRIPKTEKSGRVHTSTVTVAVLPAASPIQLNLKTEDIKFESFRASGHGGQNVNKVSTAVRLTHLPTNTIVACQEERSQSQNRERAFRILEAKLYEMMTLQKKNSIDELRREQIGQAFRAEKIKTYNFPQDRLTDHRLGKSWHNLEKLMDGELESVLL